MNHQSLFEKAIDSYASEIGSYSINAEARRKESYLGDLVQMYWQRGGI